MSRRYTPRRAGKRWLEGAPPFVLDCFDHPGFADRYTIIFGGDLIEGDKTYAGTWLHYLAAGPGASSSGDFSAHDAMMYRYRNKHRRIRWLDLPEEERQRAIRWATED